MIYYERFQKHEPWLYVLLLGAIEIISNLLNSVVGGGLHAFLLIWLVVRGSLHSDRHVGKLLISFSVCTMIRIIGFAISPSVFPALWYYTVTEAVVLGAGIWSVLINGYTARQIGLQVPYRLWTSPLILVSGLIIGWVESRIIHPSTLSVGLTWSQVWFPSLMLIIFTGFSEELIFRGIIQHAASTVYGPWKATLFTAIAWAFLHVGWRSVLEFCLVLLVGVFWGLVRYYNRSVISLSLAHGIANIMLFVVLPHINQ